MRGYGVLQIEPTDVCNLKCLMCAPHAQPSRTTHGEAPRGYMDFDLYRKMIDEMVRDGVEFDHVIFQWLGEPTLHPRWHEMIEYALARLTPLCNFVRFDTNALRLTPAATDYLIGALRRYSGSRLLAVFSLDAVDRDTYRVVKGADAFDLVMDQLDYFLQARRGLDLTRQHLHGEFQFVLQEQNAPSLRKFVDFWKARLWTAPAPGQWDTIMIKRLAAGTGGEAQRRADELYERTLAEQGIAGEGTACGEVKIWERRPWHE